MDKIAKKQKKASLLKQALRTFGLMSKQSTGLFLCRSLPRKLRRSLPLVVRIHIIYTKIKTNHKSDWFLFGGRGWIRTTEAEQRQIYSLFPLAARELFHIGAGERTRTPDLLITNQLLYQLSYTSVSPTPNYYIISQNNSQDLFCFF